MAARLIDLAQSSPAVQRVIAHTLPEPNASTRILQKVGMRFVIDAQALPSDSFAIAPLIVAQFGS